jgi:hypothetical protein
MKRLMMSALLLGAAAFVPVQAAEDSTADAKTAASSPAPKPTADEHPPTNRMDSATPEMKTNDPDTEQHAPTKRMGEAVPPMKPGDTPTSPNTPSTQTPPPSDETTTLPGSDAPKQSTE